MQYRMGITTISRNIYDRNRNVLWKILKLSGNLWYVLFFFFFFIYRNLFSHRPTRVYCSKKYVKLTGANNFAVTKSSPLSSISCESNHTSLTWPIIGYFEIWFGSKNILPSEFVHWNANASLKWSTSGKCNSGSGIIITMRVKKCLFADLTKL